MKILLSTLAVVALATTSAQTSNSGAYCAGTYSDAIFPVDHHISQVSIGSLTNVSGEIQYPAPHYVHYSNLNAPVFNCGQTYTLTIHHDDGQTIHGIAAWIDYNKNNTFESSEKIGETLWPGDGNSSNGSSVSYSVTIPTNIPSGQSRLRVRIYEDDDYTFSGNNLPVLPCQFGSMDLAWGETEDYTVQFQAVSTASIQAETILPFTQAGYLLQFEEPITFEAFTSSGIKVAEGNGETILLNPTLHGVLFLHLTTDSGKEKRVRIYLD